MALFYSAGLCAVSIISAVATKKGGRIGRAPYVWRNEVLSSRNLAPRNFKLRPGEISGPNRFVIGFNCLSTVTVSSLIVTHTVFTSCLATNRIRSSWTLVFRMLSVRCRWLYDALDRVFTFGCTQPTKSSLPRFPQQWRCYAVLMLFY